MPHILLEYTANVGQPVQYKKLFTKIHRILADKGGVDINACKSRLLCLDDFVSGDSTNSPGFLHLKIEIFPKTNAWKAIIGPPLLDALLEAFPEHGQAPVTVHIADYVERNSYFKHPPINPTSQDQCNTNQQKVSEAFAIKAETGSNKALMDLCSDDIKWTITGTGKLCRTYTSKADFVDNCLSVLGSRIDGSIKAQVERIIAKDDTVTILWKGKGQTIWGEQYENDYCWVFDFSDGVVTRAVAYIDTLLLERVISHPT